MFAAMLTLSTLCLAMTPPIPQGDLQYNCPGATQCIIGCNICGHKYVDWADKSGSSKFIHEKVDCLCDLFKCGAYCVSRHCDAKSRKNVEPFGKELMKELMEENPKFAKCRVDWNAAWQLSVVVPVLMMFIFY